jgi:hypothetical protein
MCTLYSVQAVLERKKNKNLCCRYYLKLVERSEENIENIQTSTPVRETKLEIDTEDFYMHSRKTMVWAYWIQILIRESEVRIRLRILPSSIKNGEKKT